MSILGEQIKELREAARQFEGYQNGEISRMMREAAYTIESLRDRLQAATLGSEPPYEQLLRCLENDWNISASWDGLRRFWNIGLTEEGVRLRDAELNSRAERTCECIAEHVCSPFDGKTIVLHRCSVCNEFMRPFMKYCPNCGAKVIEEVD